MRASIWTLLLGLGLWLGAKAALPKPVATYHISAAWDMTDSASSYRVYVGLVGASIGLVTTTTTPFVTISNLAYGSNYSLQVTAVNGYGESPPATLGIPLPRTNIVTVVTTDERNTNLPASLWMPLVSVTNTFTNLSERTFFRGKLDITWTNAWDMMIGRDQ